MLEEEQAQSVSAEEPEIRPTVAAPDDERPTIVTGSGSFPAVSEWAATPIETSTGIGRLAADALPTRPPTPPLSQSPGAGFDRWFTPTIQAAPMDLDNPAASAVFGALAAAEPMLPPVHPHRWARPLTSIRVRAGQGARIKHRPGLDRERGLVRAAGFG